MNLTELGLSILETRKEWSRIETKIPNIFVRVLPRKIVIEYNPTDRNLKPTLLSGFNFSSMEDVKSCLKTITSILVNEIINKFDINNVEEYRSDTDILNIFVIKTKDKGNVPCLAVEYNPVNDKGKPKHKNGLFFKSEADLRYCINILNHKKLDDIFNSIFLNLK